jgi:hypothetical protein
VALTGGVHDAEMVPPKRIFMHSDHPLIEIISLDVIPVYIVHEYILSLCKSKLYFESNEAADFMPEPLLKIHPGRIPITHTVIHRHIQASYALSKGLQ